MPGVFCAARWTNLDLGVHFRRSRGKNAAMNYARVPAQTTKWAKSRPRPGDPLIWLDPSRITLIDARSRLPFRPYCFWPIADHLSRLYVPLVRRVGKYSPNIRLYYFHVPRPNARHPSLCRQLQRMSAEYRRSSADLAGIMDRCRVPTLRRETPLSAGGHFPGTANP